LKKRRIDLSKFTIFQTGLRNQSTLTPNFLLTVYSIFRNYHIHDYIVFARPFYQTKCETILQGDFVPNKAIFKVTILS